MTLADAPVIGLQRPPIFCYPEDTVTTLGTEANELAQLAGLYLDDWQEFSLDMWLGQRDDGQWSAFEVLEIVGRQNGKGSILEARELAGLYLIRSDRLIIHTAHEFKTAEEHFLRLQFLIENTPELSQCVESMPTAHGQEAIILKPRPTLIMGAGGKYVQRNGRKRLRILARSQGSGRGFTGDLLVFDEAMKLDAPKVGAILPTLSARPNPQVIYTASAGMITSTQLANVRRRMVAGTSKSLCGLEWSCKFCDEYCDPDCDKHDVPYTVEAYAKSNPALGIRISLDYLRKEADALEGDEEEHYRERFGIGTYPAPLDSWLVIPKTWWNATLDSGDPPELRNIVFAIDTSPDRSMTSIYVAGERPDGLVQVELADRHGGTGWVLKRIKELVERWHPVAIAIDRRAAAGSLIGDMEKEDFPVESMTATDVAYACGQLFDAFRDDWLRHPKDESWMKALAACDKRPLSEAWAFDRRNVAVDLTPLMAATFALWAYVKFGKGAEYDIAESVHFDLAEIARMIKAGVYDMGDLKRLAAEKIITENDIATVLKTAQET